MISGVQREPPLAVRRGHRDVTRRARRRAAAPYRHDIDISPGLSGQQESSKVTGLVVRMKILDQNGL